ncbi:MAG: diguanylate cyclase [Clostridia bacterium]|nr:diguanylate cyclase [Clostridia bacterium]
MKNLIQAKQEGISLKKMTWVMLAISLLIALLLFFAVTSAFRSFRQMGKMTDNYIILQDATAELMEASDFLTEEAQCYTVIGKRVHLDNYLTEAEVKRRREHAIVTMEGEVPDSAALLDLKEAMNESVSLMDREYYAMRLVLEATGDSDIPAPLRNVQLKAEDQALSPEKKIELARQLMHDEEYYEQKSRIRSNLAACVQELKSSVHGEQQKMEQQTHQNMILVSLLIILQTLAVFLMLWMITRLGLNPVLRAVDHIRKDQRIPIVGASEFRYLAGTYNMMYNAYKKSIEKLNFKASHDELTGVYNRAGFDLIKTSLDLSSSALMLLDADLFKSVNDTYGHETGDQILKKIAATLKKNFRSDDYICRIGGDEFVVFMVHVNSEAGGLIERKVMQINQNLADTSDGLPFISMSAGVAFGTKDSDSAELFRRADTALYYVKEHGRNSCCFYSSRMKRKDSVSAG